MEGYSADKDLEILQYEKIKIITFTSNFISFNISDCNKII